MNIDQRYSTDNSKETVFISNITEWMLAWSLSEVCFRMNWAFPVVKMTHHNVSLSSLRAQFFRDTWFTRDSHTTNIWSPQNAWLNHPTAYKGVLISSKACLSAEHKLLILVNVAECNYIFWLQGLDLFLSFFHCGFAALTEVKCLNTSTTVGNTGELYSQWQRNADRLWPGKPTAKGCRSESHCSVFSMCMFPSSLTIYFLSPSGYLLCHTHNIRHLTEYKGCQHHSAA